MLTALPNVQALLVVQMSWLLSAPIPLQKFLQSVGVQLLFARIVSLNPPLMLHEQTLFVGPITASCTDPSSTSSSFSGATHRFPSFETDEHPTKVALMQNASAEKARNANIIILLRDVESPQPGAASVHLTSPHRSTATLQIGLLWRSTMTSMATVTILFTPLVLRIGVGASLDPPSMD